MVDDFDLYHPLSVGTHIHQILLLAVKSVRLYLCEHFLSNVVLVPQLVDFLEKEARTLFKIEASIEPAIAKTIIATLAQERCSLLL